MKKSNLSSKNRNFDLVNFMAGNGVIWLLLILSAFMIFSAVVGSNPVYDLSQVYEIHPVKEYGYCFSTSYNSEYFAILFVAAALGITSFSFLTNKQQGITMLSLPVKRSKLFNQKVILPVCTLALIVIAIKAIMIYYNIKISGVNSAVITQGITDIAISLKYILLGFTAFTVSAVACGKKLEVILGGISLIGILPTIYDAVNSLLLEYLYGYDSMFYSDTAVYSDYVFALHPTREIAMISFLLEERQLLTDSKLVINLLWIVALIIVLVLTKMHFVKKYKPEKIEMKATNKTMVAIISTTISLFASLIISVMYEDFGIITDNKVYSANISVLLTVILTIVFAYLTSVLIETSFAINSSKIKAVCTPLAVIALTLLFAFSGGLGYEKRIPDTEKIKEVEITTTFNADDNFNTHEALSLENIYANNHLTLTTENDFKIIKAIHEAVIENRDTTTAESIYITYTLKNGKTITRSYDYLSKEAAEKMLMLWKTDEVHKNIKDYLFNNKPTNTYEDFGDGDSYYAYASYDYYETPYSCFNYDTNAVLIASKQNTATDIKDKITKAEFRLIKEAIYKDYTELTPAEWFKPTKTYGAIVFRYDNKYYGSYYTDTFADNYTYEEDEDFWYGFSEYEHIVLPVTVEMKSTVEILKKLDLSQYLGIKNEIQTAYVADISEYWEWRSSEYSDIGYLLGALDKSVYFVPDGDLERDINFFKSSNLNPTYDEDLYGSAFEELDYSKAPIEEIKSQKEIAALLEKSHIKYYDEESDGKLLFVDYKDNADNVYYIPN